MDASVARADNGNTLTHIQDVQPLDAVDEACLAEIEVVLAKYNRTARFGVAVLHKHFDVAPDEVLIERTYAATRQLVTQPVRASEVTGDLITTIWRFDNSVRYACSYCKKNHCQS